MGSTFVYGSQILFQADKLLLLTISTFSHFNAMKNAKQTYQNLYKWDSCGANIKEITATEDTASNCAVTWVG